MRRKILALGLPLAITSVTLLGVPQSADAEPAPSTASADAQVSQTSPGANYGNNTRLVLNGKSASKSSALLKFKVPGLAVNEEVTGVQLLVRPQTSTSRIVNVYAASSNWSEASVNWRNAPVAGTRLGSSNSLVSGTTEVISLAPNGFTPGSTVTVRLETTSTTEVRVASSEAGTVSARPVLKLTTRTVTPPPPPTCETDPSLCPPPPPPPASWPPAAPYATHVIGMSAPANLWDQRISEVGADGVNSRRIFGDLTSTGTSQMPLIKEALADGMIPVISYKVPSVDALIAGDYDAWMANLRSQLIATGGQVTVTFWHEPYGDMEPAKFRAASLRFFNAVDAPSIAVGPILNGWLLDRRVADFSSFTDPTLLSKWEFVGVDSYQEGSEADPNPSLLPARAVPKTAAWLETQGYGSKPIVLGEYNGFTGSAMQQAGEYILSTPELWIGNVWNVDATAGPFRVLTGERLTAFRATKADPRAVR